MSSDGIAIQERAQMPVDSSEEPLDFWKIMEQSERTGIERQNSVAGAACDHDLLHPVPGAIDSKLVRTLRDAFFESDADGDFRLTEDEIDTGLGIAGRGSKLHTVLQNMKDSFSALAIISGKAGDIEIGDIDRLALLSAGLTEDARVTRDAEFALANFENIDRNGDGFLSTRELHVQCVSVYSRNLSSSERSLISLQQSYGRVRDQSKDGANDNLGISRADFAQAPVTERFNGLLRRTYQSAARIEMVNLGGAVGATAGGVVGGLVGLGGGPWGVAAGVPFGALVGLFTGSVAGEAAAGPVADYQFERNNATVRAFIESTASAEPTLMHPASAKKSRAEAYESKFEKSFDSRSLFTLQSILQ